MIWVCLAGASRAVTDIPMANYWRCGQVKRNVSAALRARTCRLHTDKAVETTIAKVFAIPFTGPLAISFKAYLNIAALKNNDLHFSLHMWLNVKKQAPFAVMSKVVNFGSCWDKEVECEMPSSSQDAWWGYKRAKKKSLSCFLSFFSPSRTFSPGPTFTSSKV